MKTSELGDKGTALELTDDLGVKSGTLLTPVINTYIMPMVAELVREQLALIILTELPHQKVLAEDLSVNALHTIQGRQALKDLQDGIYDIINNIFIEKGTHFQAAQMPGINIYYGRSDFSATEGDNITQVSNSNYSIGVHVTKEHLKKGDAPIVDGDKLSAYMTARVLGILRAILMSGQYITLGNTFKGIIYGRRVSGLDVFLPDAQESDGRHGIVGILNISVKFKELSPEKEGTLLASASTAITAKLRTADDGKVILIENEEV
jgi:hypothetical protein